MAMCLNVCVVALQVEAGEETLKHDNGHFPTRAVAPVLLCVLPRRGREARESGRDEATDLWTY